MQSSMLFSNKNQNQYQQYKSFKNDDDVIVQETFFQGENVQKLKQLSNVEHIKNNSLNSEKQLE
jgi:hypothetical protein